MSLLSQRKKKPSGQGGASSSISFPQDGRRDPSSAGRMIVIGKHQQQQLNRFLSKTFHMVNNIDVDVVSWNPSGEDSFVIEDIDEFSKTTLPLYFNHSNYSSFVRQLNFYGFSKVRQDCSPLKNEEEEERKQLTVCFYHEYFCKDRPDLLHKIHRVTKKGRKKNDPMSDGQRIRELQREVDAVYDEMRAVQSQMESKLDEVKRSMQQEYEKRIAKLEETCMGMIVLLQSSTSTCSSASSYNSPLSSSYHPYSHSPPILGRHSSCLSSASMISPPRASRSFWPSVRPMMAPTTTALRRASWVRASSSSTTTTGPVPPPHDHHHDPTTHAKSNASSAPSVSLFSSPETTNIKSSDTTTLLMLSAAGLIR